MHAPEKECFAERTVFDNFEASRNLERKSLAGSLLKEPFLRVK